MIEDSKRRRAGGEGDGPDDLAKKRRELLDALIAKLGGPDLLAANDVADGLGRDSREGRAYWAVDDALGRKCPRL
jgi:hypothetical protein